MPGTSECFRPFPGARHRHRLCCTRSNDHNTRVDCAECHSPANPIALVLTLATATVLCATKPASPSLRSYRPVCFLDARLAVSSGWKTSRTYLTCPASAPTTDSIRDALQADACSIPSAMSDTLQRPVWDGHPVSLGTGLALPKPKGERVATDPQVRLGAGTRSEWAAVAVAGLSLAG